MASTTFTTRTPAVALLTMLAVCTGCTSFDLPSLSMKPQKLSGYAGIDGAAPLTGSVSEQAYHSVRQAKSQNAIVLQVVGDSTPMRVLPLPEGRAVYVSDLLKQTGVAEKLGSIGATLYRSSADSINGLPMEVKVASDGKTVRPETDYALQPGDRLQVQKVVSPALKGMLGGLLGI